MIAIPFFSSIIILTILLFVDLPSTITAVLILTMFLGPFPFMYLWDRAHERYTLDRLQEIDDAFREGRLDDIL